MAFNRSSICGIVHLSQTTMDNKDRSGSVTVVDENGKVVSEAPLPYAVVKAAQAAGEAVSLPMPELLVTADREYAPTINVSLSTSGAVQVEAPRRKSYSAPALCYAKCCLL